MGTKLQKVAQKVFASTPGINQISKFGSFAAGAPAFASTATEAQTCSDAMSQSNWLTGWFAAILSGSNPAIEDQNAFSYVVSRQLAYNQQMGIPEWDATTEYFIGSLILVGVGKVYSSKTDNNIGNAYTDTTNWKPVISGSPTGTGKDFWGTALPEGFVWAAGKTIGNTGSGATERANADCFDLFSVFWAGYTDSQLPIFTSVGGGSARGSSALADWNANKAITVIDKRGRVSAGMDNMGGTGAGRLTTAGKATLDGTKLGAASGEQDHTLTVAEMPSHNHSMPLSGTSLSLNNISGPIAGGGYNTGFTGGDGAHNNVQPTIVCNYILKL